MVGSRAVLSTLVFLLALIAGVVAVLPQRTTGRSVVHAEFKDAFPLVPRADVRRFGAKVGSQAG